MSVRFRKSFKLGKFMRLNVSKKSVGVSAGNKWFGVSTSTSERRSHRSTIPKTGISFVSSKKKK